MEFAQVQGIVFNAHAHLEAACYVGLRVNDAAATRQWLTELVPDLSYADERRASGVARNLAFSAPALEALSMPHQLRKGFSREFQEGMAGSRYRSRILGDIGDSAPQCWHWGGPQQPDLHFLLLLYASDAAELEALLEAERARFAGALDEVLMLPTRTLPGQREHFGFRDGISQPRVRGVSRSTDPAHAVAAGEFVLGYENEHAQYTMGPHVDAIEDPHGLLPPNPRASDSHDFARNGSYLVVRQLEQDVARFWSFARENCAADPVRVAAKMVGRWPGGAPLATATHDDPARSHDNDFRYHRDGDAQGLGCPLGAHVRRTNPRDALPPKPGEDASLAVNRRHRILRRGRVYGEPLLAEPEAQELAAAPDDGEARGLHFLCVNANISRQFEFIQHAWINNAHFAGLQGETDPLMGTRQKGDQFTLPQQPVRERLEGLPGFVTVRGGGYFFLPSRAALGYLCHEQPSLASDYAAPAPPAVHIPVSLGLRAGRRISRAMERVIGLSRRATGVQRFVERHLRDRIMRLVQAWLRRGLREQGLDIAEERVDYREAEIAQQISATMTKFLFTHYPNGGAERAGNTKTYGLVKARFEVERLLPDGYAAGVFQPGASYPAYVRFGGPGPLATPDIRNNGILSLGVKLMGVPGEKCLDDERHTQDFTAISAPTFTTPTVFENLKLQRHIGRGTPVFYFLNPFDAHIADAIMQGLYAKAHANPLETPYWSCVPYLYGEGQACKYQFVPVATHASVVPSRPGDDYLREAMVATLLASEWCFDVYVQLQTDPVLMPVENSSIIWPDKLSAQVRVARLRIPRQRFDAPEQLAFARNLSFNPWHCVKEHRPLGNQGRARKHIYNETSRVRQQINREARVEPTGDEF